MISSIPELITNLIFDKNTWYLIGTLGTFLIAAISLWLKYSSGSKKIIDKIDDLDKRNNAAHATLLTKVDENSAITKEYSSRRDYYNILDNIKNEAVNWSPNNFNDFITIKAKAMRDFFVGIEKIGFNNTSIETIDSELKISINTFKREANENGYSEFVKFFFKKSHTKYTSEYLRDLKDYKGGRINNLNEAFLSRSVVFYRHSLENAINVWSEWIQNGEK